MSSAIHMKFTFRAFAEDRPGPLWQKHFKPLWPGYRRWFLRYGERDRPTYLESLLALKKYIPEFLPHYEALTDLAGGGDHSARFLAQYCPPPLFRGCSQAVYLQDESVLVRNYDYSPYVFDGLVMRSRFHERGVIAMLDCMSGALDGINSDGLAVSISFGGRQEFGSGFGIPLIVRYLLEFAGDVAEARRLLHRIPVHGAYNVTLLDAADHFDTVAIAPGVEPCSLGDAVATNHQPGSSWPIYEEKVYTHLRYDHLAAISAARQHGAYGFTREFLNPPLYSKKFARGFGTLYSAAFYPRHRSCEYFWPEHAWNFGFDRFEDSEYRIDFVDPEGYPKKSQTYSEIYTGAPVPALQF